MINKIKNNKWYVIFIIAFILGITTTFIWSGSISLRFDTYQQSIASEKKVNFFQNLLLKSCKSDKDCKTNSYCNLKSCGDVEGKCIIAPTDCPLDSNPVCGCDGKTYNNDCLRQSAKISQDYLGECKEESQDTPYLFFNLHIHPESANDRMFAVLEKLINLADSYNTKLTLGFHIQWVDMILADEIKTKKVREWQKNGHEIAIEHHSANHAGWDGYSNLPKEIAIEIYNKFFLEPGIVKGFPFYLDPDNPYLGTFDEAYARFNQLAYPKTVKSGVTTIKSEMPTEHIYELDSLKVAPWADGRTSKVAVDTFNNHKIYRINVRSGYLNDDWKTNVEECDKASPNEVCGFIAHLEDYAADRFETAKKVWGYYFKKDPEGLKRKSVSWIMENHIIPNDLIIHEECGNTICGNKEFETNSCPGDCNKCNKQLFGDYWIDIHTGSQFNCEVGDSHKIYLMGKSK